MFKKLYEWFRGEINPFSLDNIGEKQTPETKQSEPLPQPEESEYERSRRIREEEREREYERKRKELQEKVDEIILTEEEFGVGDQVQYLKVPNDNVDFYVSQYYHAYVSEYYFSHIETGKVTVQYFDANQILQTIKDEIKWFKKVGVV